MKRAFKWFLQVSLIILIYKAITISSRVVYGYVSYSPNDFKDYTQSDFL